MIYRPPLRVHVNDLLSYTVLVFSVGFISAGSLAVGALFLWL